VLTGGAKSEADNQTFSVLQRPRLQVRIRTPGSIDVMKGSDGQVSVKAEITERYSLDYRVAQESNTITVSCRTKTWDPLLWGSYVFSSGPRANILVTVPQDSDLNLENVTDRISVSGISGTNTCESTTGRIQMKDCAGTISVRSHTGNIDLENVNGLIDIHDTIGTVNYSGSLAAGSNAIGTTTGDITVALKGTQDLLIDASTTVGHIVSRVDLAESKYDRGSYIGQHISGRIGSGKGRLTLDATTGSISILPS
jgi:DUF4097 and DUF4098 domain-containing protein YvlB